MVSLPIKIFETRYFLYTHEDSLAAANVQLIRCFYLVVLIKSELIRKLTHR